MTLETLFIFVWYYTIIYFVNYTKIDKELENVVKYVKYYNKVVK